MAIYFLKRSDGSARGFERNLAGVGRKKASRRLPENLDEGSSMGSGCAQNQIGVGQGLSRLRKSSLSCNTPKALYQGTISVGPIGPEKRDGLQPPKDVFRPAVTENLPSSAACKARLVRLPLFACLES